MSGEKRESTLVVGGGIAGLATALGLGRQGLEVTVLERSAEFGEVGAGIQLAPNAMAVLDSLGVMDEIMKDAVLPQRKRYMDAVTGKEIATIDLGPEFVAHFGYPYIVTHRADLHGALLKGCQECPTVTLVTGAAVTAAENQEDGTVVVTCADERTFSADRVVGADGVRSALRTQLVADELVPSRYVAYRGTVPIEVVGPEAAEEPVVLCWLGPNMHLIQYPLRGGKIYNNVAVFKSDAYSPDHEDWGTEAELEERLSVCCDQVKEAADYLRRDFRWPMYDRNPADHYVDGHIALVGDAAHAMLQYLAQGGAQSLDDALVLSQELGAGATDEAFAAYERRRVEHTGNIQRLARVAGELFHFDDIGRQLRNHFFAGHDPKDYSNLEWMFMPVDRAPEVRQYPV